MAPLIGAMNSVPEFGSVELVVRLGVAARNLIPCSQKCLPFYAVCCSETCTLLRTFYNGISDDRVIGAKTDGQVRLRLASICSDITASSFCRSNVYTLLSKYTRSQVATNSKAVVVISMPGPLYLLCRNWVIDLAVILVQAHRCA